MTTEIDNRIIELEEYVYKQRKLIIRINNEIINREFLPSELQQVIIDHICQQGQLGLIEIDTLKRFKNGLNL
jgi:uncharacterized coiled-coil protein SlyX